MPAESFTEWNECNATLIGVLMVVAKFQQIPISQVTARGMADCLVKLDQLTNRNGHQLEADTIALAGQLGMQVKQTNYRNPEAN